MPPQPMQPQRPPVPESYHFIGTKGGAFSHYFLAFLFQIPFLATFMKLRLLKWIQANTIVNEKALQLNLSFGKLLVKRIVWNILTVVTIGIFIIGGFKARALIALVAEFTVFSDKPVDKEKLEKAKNKGKKKDKGDDDDDGDGKGGKGKKDDKGKDDKKGKDEKADKGKKDDKKGKNKKGKDSDDGDDD
ncbi:MAG: hypothetical protein FWD86_01230 [Firmicutes bacterium]|nr:hypothetical protein [Bacillota bacterium]